MAKPKLALIPASQGDKLYSVLPSGGVGDFDFTRNSSATRINKDGLIETVGSGVSRLNYPMIDGVVSGCPSHILEPLRRNIALYSSSFDNSYWNKNRSTIISDNIISPDGTQNADKFLETTDNNSHNITKLISDNTGKNLSVSVFMKKAERNYGVIYVGSGPGKGVLFDLEDGVIVKNIGLAPNWKKIEDYGNGWYRCSMGYTSTDGSSEVTFGIAKDSTGNSSYVGDASKGIYIWGAQVEDSGIGINADYVSSYIPTTTSITTRSAETANGSGDAATFNDSEGVLMAEISALATAPTRVITLGDGTSANRVQFFYNSSNILNANVINIGSQVTGFVYNGDANLFNKCALKYKVNDFAFWVNGFKIEVDTDGITPTGLNKLSFDNGTGPADFYGNTKQIQYFDTALSDTDLETLTSWVSFQEMAQSQLYSIE